MPVLRVRRAVASGVLPPTAGLDGARWRVYRCTGPAGRKVSQSGLLEALLAATKDAAGVEPEAELQGVKGDEAQSPACRPAAASQARARGAVRAAAARYGVVDRFHKRCAGMWPALPHFQRRGRLQPGGAAHRGRHLDNLGTAGAHHRTDQAWPRTAASAAIGQRPGVPGRGIHSVA